MLTQKRQIKAPFVWGKVSMETYNGVILLNKVNIFVSRLKRGRFLFLPKTCQWLGHRYPNFRMKTAENTFKTVTNLEQRWKEIRQNTSQTQGDTRYCSSTLHLMMKFWWKQHFSFKPLINLYKPACLAEDRMKTCIWWRKFI